MPHLSLQDIEKYISDKHVINGVDLEIERGEFCVLFGPSGSGKSTLLNLISGLDHVTSGKIHIDEKLVNDMPATERGTGMVFQSFALYPHMTVRQNLSFGLENTKTPRREIRTRVLEIAEMLGIEDLLNRRPHTLSGGEKQRVAIGRALALEPDIFLFDEPFSNLDGELRATMRNEIVELHQKLGSTMLYVTHDQVEAMTMADKIAIINHGSIEQFGAPLEIYNRPKNMFVAGAIGTPRMNFIEGTATNVTLKGCVFQPRESTGFKLFFKNFDVKDGDKITLGFRPNHIDIVDLKNADMKVNTGKIEQLGGSSLLETSFDGDTITIQLPGQRNIEEGDEIGLSVDQGEFHMFSTDTRKSLLKD